MSSKNQPSEPKALDEALRATTLAMSGKSVGYASVSMQDRRRRILDAARRMVAERGMDGFSMRELGARANVAPRTLYNAFQSRDHLLAEAIREYFQDFVARHAYEEEAGTLKGTLERMDVVHRRNLEIKNYTRTIMALYFSINVDTKLWDTIHEILAEHQRLWLQRLSNDGMLRPGVDVDKAANRLTNLEYATMFQWCQDRIPDADFISSLKVTVLTYVAGVTQGEAMAEIQSALDDLY